MVKKNWHFKLFYLAISSLLFFSISTFISLWIYDYEQFIEFILVLYGKESYLDKFTNELFKPEQFQILRFFNFSIIVLLIFVLAKAKLVYNLFQNAFQLLSSLFRDHKQFYFKLNKQNKIIMGTNFALIFSFYAYLVLNLPFSPDETYNYNHYISEGILTSYLLHTSTANHTLLSISASVFDAFLPVKLSIRLPNLLTFIFAFSIVFRYFYSRKNNILSSSLITATLFFSYPFVLHFVLGRAYGFLIFFSITQFIALQKLMENKESNSAKLIYVISATFGIATIPSYLYFHVVTVGVLLLNRKFREVYLLQSVIFLFTTIFYAPIFIANGTGFLASGISLRNNRLGINQIYQIIEKYYNYIFSFEFRYVSIIILLSLFITAFFIGNKRKTTYFVLFVFAPIFLSIPFQIFPPDRVWSFVPFIVFALLLNFNINEKILIISSLSLAIYGFLFFKWNFPKKYHIAYENQKFVEKVEACSVKKLIFDKNPKSFVGTYYEALNFKGFSQEIEYAILDSNSFSKSLNTIKIITKEKYLLYQNLKKFPIFYQDENIIALGKNCAD